MAANLGNGHITIRRPDLVDRINLILAEGDGIPDASRHHRQREAA